MKYWLLEDYLGIGPSAHSMVNSKRFFYPRNINEYPSHNVIYESEGNTPQEYLMLSLRTDSGFDYDVFKNKFGITPTQALLNDVWKFANYGLIESTNKSFRLSEKGFLLSNTIISELLDSAFE